MSLTCHQLFRFVSTNHCLPEIPVTWSQMTFNSYTKDYELRSALVDRHLSAVKTRQEAVLYLTAWKYGPYLDDDPSGEIPDSAGLRVLIEEALRES